MNSVTPNPKTYTKISALNNCSSAFNCGAEYSTMKMQVDLLSERVESLEMDKKKTSKYVSVAVNLMKLQRFLLILLPIVELIVVGIVMYLFAGHNAIGYTVIALIGISTVINGFALPKQMKDIEDRLSKIEDKSDKK